MIYAILARNGSYLWLDLISIEYATISENVTWKINLGMDLGILGFDDEIPPMNVGGKRLLNIPSVLAYGENELGPIPANQDLQFELEVLDAGNENQVDLSTRILGYVAAAGTPLVVLFVAFNLAAGNF